MKVIRLLLHSLVGLSIIWLLIYYLPYIAINIDNKVSFGIFEISILRELRIMYSSMIPPFVSILISLLNLIDCFIQYISNHKKHFVFYVILSFAILFVHGFALYKLFTSTIVSV